MSRKLNVVLAIAVAFGGANLALADAGHHTQNMPEDQAMDQNNAANNSKHPMMGGNPMMDGGHHEMMQAMMQMHRDMMQKGMGMQETMNPMDIMDQDMMGFMQASMGNNVKADANGDGTVSREETQEHFRSMLAVADKDSNGSISIEEFEAFHSMMMQGRMVDRFQHLDSDGNGEITESEMTAPANRMKM